MSTSTKAKPDRVKPGFTAHDIFKGKNLDLSVITLTKRYPETGRAVNDTCEMVVRITKGSVRFQQGGFGGTFKKGETVHVSSGNPYFWEPEGKSVTFEVVSSPPWNPKQHRVV